MKEHLHEWKEEYNEEGHYGSTHIVCECGEIMPSEEIERRLNATERLSAEAAKDIVAWSGGNNKHVMDMVNWYALKAYADILEGK